MVRSPGFESAFAALIMINTVVLVLEVQYHGIEIGHQLRYHDSPNAAEDSWPAAKAVFSVCEWLFGLIFALEVVIKTAALRLRVFRDRWNWLDMLVVVSWAATEAGEAFLPLNSSLLRMARLLRLLRMLRLVRIIKGFDSLYLLTTSLRASGSALLWSSALVFTIQIVFALVLSEALRGYILDDANPMEERLKIYMYYGTFSRATLTMFELALANWPAPSRPLTEAVSEWYVLFVLGYQIVVGFAVVRVIMGVFLQVTFAVASTDDLLMVKQKERAMRIHKQKVAMLFKVGDDDKNGYLDREEFRALVQDPLVAKWLAAMESNVGLFAGDSDSLFDLLDRGTESLSVDELAAGITRLKGPARAIDMAVLMKENRELHAVMEEIRIELEALSQSGCQQEGGSQPGAAGDRPCRRLSRFETDPGPCSPGRTLSKGAASPLGLVAIPRIDSDLSFASPASPSLSPARSTGSRDSSTGDESPPNKGSRRSSTVGDAIFDRSGTGGFAASRAPASEDEDQPSSTASATDRLRELVGDCRFEGFFAALVGVSILVVALEVQYRGLDAGHALGYPGSTGSSARTWPGAAEAFHVLDLIVGALFAAEIAVKLVVLRLDYFRDALHLLDVFVVGASLAGTLLTGAFPVYNRVLRIVRLLRLLRMTRGTSFIQGVDSLHLMTTSIKGSFAALSWATVLLLLVEMMIVLVLNQMLEPWILDASNPLGGRHQVYRYFGTFSKGMLTMFEITLANWAPACRTLTEHVSEWYTVFTLVHKFFIGFAVVMVITGVIMQETFKVASSDDNIMMSQRERAIKVHATKMRRLFQSVDVHNSGFVDKEQFRQTVSEGMVKTWLAAMGLDVSDVDKVLDLLEDGDGEMTVEDLVVGVDRLKGSARSVDLAVVLYESRQLRTSLDNLLAQGGRKQEVVDALRTP